MKLTISATLKAIDVILPFISAAAKYYGAEQNECRDTALLAEEAAVSIINRFSESGGGHSEIQLEIRPEGKGIALSIRDKGMPINLKSLPGYDAGNPEKSVFGLGLHLMRKLSDKFEFRNLGGDGWETYFYKKLRKSVVPEKTGPLPHSGQIPKRRNDFEIREVTPGEAFEIVKLSYLTYRYTYSKDNFYYPEAVEGLIKSGTMRSFGAFLPDGSLAGHIGLLNDPEEAPSITEIGVVMVKPDYRDSTCLFRLLRIAREKAENNPGHLNIFRFVTAHTRSQKIGNLFKTAPCAIQLSYHDRADFKSMDTTPGNRESLLISCVNFQDEKFHTQIFPPPEHRKQIRQLLDDAGFEINEMSPVAKENRGKTKYRINRNNFYCVASIKVIHPGADFAEILKKERFELAVEGFQSIYLYLPMWKPECAGLGTTAREGGFFFSGIYPHNPSMWYVMYTFLVNRVIDYSEIALAGDAALRLREYVAGQNSLAIPF